jgi:DNA-binding XRE family transcriptional regulator
MGYIGNIFMFDLGSSMRQARKEKKLTQAQLAEMAGLSRKTLGQIETDTVTDIGIRKV